MDHNDFDSMTPLQMARALMVDHPASFKVGYSPENAALAAQSVYSLTDEETSELRKQLTNEHDLFEQLGELATRENSEKLAGREREWVVGVTVGQVLCQAGGDRTRAVEIARQIGAAIDNLPAESARENIGGIWATALRALETLAEMPDELVEP